MDVFCFFSEFSFGPRCSFVQPSCSLRRAFDKPTHDAHKFWVICGGCVYSVCRLREASRQAAKCHFAIDGAKIQKKNQFCKFFMENLYAFRFFSNFILFSGAKICKSPFNIVSLCRICIKWPFFISAGCQNLVPHIATVGWQGFWAFAFWCGRACL